MKEYKRRSDTYYVFIWRASVEPNNTGLTAVAIFLNKVRRSLNFINKVWVENIELVALDNLRRRVIMVIMCLIILVPFITSMNSVKILRLSWAIFVMPPINL